MSEVNTQPVDGNVAVPASVLIPRKGANGEVRVQTAEDQAPDAIVVKQ